MRRSWALVTVLTGVALAGVMPAAEAAADIGVSVDQSRVTTALGDTFFVHTKISNLGTKRSDLYIGHLNVVSLTRDVYVDPEDWSGSRSRDVGPLAPGAHTVLTWQIQAVNAGSFDAYVVLLPNGADTGGRGPLVASPPIHVRVAPRRTLSAEGSLPVSIAVPVLLGLVAVTIRVRSRRSA
jgi:hypothetical protein